MRMIFVMANKVYEFKFESGGPLVTTISKTINISHMDKVGVFYIKFSNSHSSYPGGIDSYEIYELELQ